MRFLLIFLLCGSFLLSGATGYAAQPTPTTIAHYLTPTSPLRSAHQIDAEILGLLYSARGHNPIWNTQTHRGRKGMAVFTASLKDYAAYHGLNVERLPFDSVEGILQNQSDDAHFTALEILMTDLVVKLTRRMRGDDLPMSEIYRDWPFSSDRGALVPALVEAINNNALEQYLTNLPPNHIKYKRLALVLRNYRTIEAEGGWQPIPQGPTIKLDEHDDRIQSIRARLRAEGYEAPEEGDDVYTQGLQESIILYQIRNGLEPDGVIGPKTLSAMNISTTQRVRQIAATMERLRQMPPFFPERHVYVNAASGWIQFFEGKDIAYDGPVVVGRNDRRTPFIRSDIRSIIFNPAWHVPARIAREDILPKLRKDPYYLEKMGYVISGMADDPTGTDIDWDLIKASDFKFRLRQSPGEMNALGKIKFDFDNHHAVYLHGTPMMELFKHAERHKSSGCIRLRDPEEFAVLVLAGNVTNWTRGSVEHEIDKGKTRWLKVLEPVPIYITYETVHFPSMDSPVFFHHDIYGHDQRLIAKLWE